MQKILDITYEDGMRMVVNVDGHAVATDMPVAKGGQDTAANPFLLFLAGLTSCSALFARKFCTERDIPTEGLAVRGVCEVGDPTCLEGMTLQLTLPEGFPEKYRKAIVKAVEQCPVKKTVLNPPAIETKIMN
ncbi:OsmC family protein [Desulfocurvus sp. DL9XJH121]